MTRVGRVHGLDETKIVDDACDIGKQLADPGSALAVLLKLPGRFEEVEGFAGNDLWTLEGKWFPVVALQERLVVEGVDLRRPSVHEQENDSLCPSREVGCLRGQWVGAVQGVTDRRPGLLAQQSCEGQSAEASASPTQYFTA